MDVGAWLRGLGLAQYEALFRDNEIEADVLVDLTESDLEKIGMPLGPRKRVLKAIANLDTTVASSPGRRRRLYAARARRGCRGAAPTDPHVL